MWPREFTKPIRAFFRRTSIMWLTMRAVPRAISVVPGPLLRRRLRPNAAVGGVPQDEFPSAICSTRIVASQAGKVNPHTRRTICLFTPTFRCPPLTCAWVRKEDFFGGYDHSPKAGIIHYANHHISPGKKQWTWGNHEFGYAWDRNLTDRIPLEYRPYIELMAGVYTDNQPDFSFLQPGETKAWSESVSTARNRSCPTGQLKRSDQYSPNSEEAGRRRLRDARTARSDCLGHRGWTAYHPRAPTPVASPTAARMGAFAKRSRAHRRRRAGCRPRRPGTGCLPD